MNVKYVLNNWEQELLNAAADAVECCIISAFMNIGGYNLLEKISKRLAKLSTGGNNIPIRILLSNKFAPNETERSDIINKLYELPNVEVRVHIKENFLHRKNYIFRTTDDIRIVVGSINTTSGGLYRNLESAAFITHSHEDPEAEKIQNAFRKAWDDSVSGKVFMNERHNMNIEPKFEKGDNVRIISTNKIGTVNQVVLRSDSVAYRVTVGEKKSLYPEKYLELFVDEEERIVDAIMNNELGGSDDFHLFQNWYRLKRPIEGNYYSYLASRTVFNSYQFKPLSKFISPGSDERLFIADEVGVGKTIETGIIITELIARNRIDRRSPILIVCPNSLGPKWVKEMKERFNLNFHLHDGSSLKSALKSIITTGYMPEGVLWSVASLSLARYADYLKLFKDINANREALVWSMVVIDEAHHMRNITTDSSELGSILSGLTEMMLMLSATPLNLRDEDLFNQLHILNPSVFPDHQTFQALLSPVKSINRCRHLLSENSPSSFIELANEFASIDAGPLGGAISHHPAVVALRKAIKSGSQLSMEEMAMYDRALISLSPLSNSFSRTLKREAIEHLITREPIKVPITLSSEERTFHDDVIVAVKEAFLAKGGDPRAEGFITNMPRRMVSSCIPAMKEYIDWILENDQILIDESDSSESVDDDSELDRIPLPAELREKFILLRNKAIMLGDFDSKYQEFMELLKKLLETLPNPQVIVFSFFVRTLKYLKRRLEADGYKVGLISGEVPVVSKGNETSRFDIMDQFQLGNFQILLSSEVGGEGLDFQYCQAIINYDLPYNPMRIEQRIGRIDRFGQAADKLFIASMYIKDTVDESIYMSLYERIHLVEESIGGLEPILGTKLIDLQKDIISGNLSDEQLEKRVRDLKISLEKSRLEKEQFEKSRHILMGDDYFTDPLHNLESHSSFVKPSDANHITRMCLGFFGSCSYKKLDSDRARIQLSKEVIAKLEQFTRLPGSEGSIGELSPLLKTQSHIDILFNGSLSHEYTDHVFLPPCGFWIRFLIRELDSENRILKAFCFRCSESVNQFNSGTYLVPLFEIMLEGFRVELDIAAVPISLKDGVVVPCDFRELSRTILQFQGDFKKDVDFYELNDLKSLIDIAAEALEQQFGDKLEKLKMENKYRADSRIESLKLGSQIRTDRLQQKIEDHINRRKEEGKEPSTEFILLTERTIENERKRTGDKILKLQEVSELSMNVSLIAIAILIV